MLLLLLLLYLTCTISSHESVMLYPVSKMLCVSYKWEHRLFMYNIYVESDCLKKERRTFWYKFQDVQLQIENTIQLQINTFRQRGSLKDRKELNLNN
jgi:hypothetical protein